MRAILILLLALAPAQTAAGDKERPEIQELMAPTAIGEDFVQGWALEAIRPRGEVDVEIELCSKPHDRILIVQLLKRTELEGAFCRTESFNIVYKGRLEPGEPFAEAVSRLMPRV